MPDLRQAIDLWNRDSIWKTLVTLDGEVLLPSGVVTGGSKEQAASGTFHRKREIRDLTHSTEELRGTIASLEGKQEQLLGEVKNLIVTPHTAWTARETRQRLMDIVAEKIRQHKTGNLREFVV